ncbi:hypothetical protein [Cytobacillus sp. IB215316]|uniref:hypothetical protein n=1 Tax=Cytobacillus sp. IB215316 TaxID=3097354 RepID=UPI002A138924|nr:hypothetical protein [Cytobacillus sp. IB215316]MDX8360140.1 hypothetical protein [Cytobacillus sp. IB215316]
MARIFVDECCDRKGSGCDKTLATDEFCCKINVSPVEHDLFFTRGCPTVTACYKIENTSDEHTIRIRVYSASGSLRQEFDVAPCSCVTKVDQGDSRITAEIPGGGGPARRATGKFDIKLFYDIH